MAVAQEGAISTMEENSAISNRLEDFLGEEAFVLLPDSVKTTLVAKWDVFEKELQSQKTELEKEKLNSEQLCFELERDLNTVRSKLETKISEHEDDVNQLKELQLAYSETRQKLSELEESHTNLSIENGSLRRERDTSSSERSDLADLAERRQHEIERLNAEWKSLSEQLLAANNAKCEALVRAEEVESKEISLEYREKRMNEEREYFNAQIKSMTAELEQRSEDLLNLKREQSNSLADIQAELAKKIEEARNFDARETALKSDVETYKARTEELTKRLKEARDSELRLEENFRQELEAQTKLAQLYKEQTDEGEEKHQELTKAVNELQSLLKKSAEKYGNMEEKFEETLCQQKEEIKKRNEAIVALKKELEHANDLIKNFNTKGLSAEGIENLSPSAAAASKLLKTGMTLTQIYSQLVSVNEELIAEKDETRRLNTYLDQILAEIEQRAPILKQQRDDYERAVSAVTGLTEQIEEAREEVDLRRREAEEATRRLSTVTRENERLGRQVKDLGQQITVLVREVEAARIGQTTRGLNNGSSSSFASTSDSVITDNLVSFHDVSELQTKNAELLSVVRELSEKIDTVETRLVEEKTSELRKELEEALKQVEDLRNARVRQEAMVESIISQRDLYKAVAEGRDDDKTNADLKKMTPSNTAKTVSPKGGFMGSVELEKKLFKTEAVLKEVEKEFETYRAEKYENEKILLQQLEKTNSELTESRSKAAKLASKEEYNTERFKIVQSNANSFHKQITILEERNVKLNEVVAKHELTVTSLRNELISYQSKLSKAEVQLERIKHENDVLKAAEARYAQEREVFYRERKSSALVTENLKQIQLQLEKKDDEVKMRLQNQNESLTKEIGLLRKKMENEADKYRESVKAWENTQKELRVKAEEASAKEAQAVDDVKTLNNDIEELRKELKECNEKLELAESRLAGRSTPTNVSTPQTPAAAPTSGKIRDLELLLNQNKNEVKSLKDQLTNARQATSQFKEIANSAEKRLTESNSATKVFKEEYERRLKETEDAKRSLEEQLSKIRNQQSQESNQRLDIERSDSEHRQEIQVLQIELQEIKSKYEEAVRAEEESRQRLGQQADLVTEVQERYERELMLHAQDVQSLNELKQTVQAHDDQLVRLEQAKKQAEFELESARKERKSVEELVKAEYKSLKEQFEVLDKENKALYEQLTNVTTQMTSLQETANVEDTSFNKSFNEEDCKNSQQLMQIIKYLRKEKEILTAKVEVIQAESARIKSQMEYSQGLLNETSSALTAERDRSLISVKSASKHFELVQKVETLSALTDSNRLLREEKEKVSSELSELKLKLNEAFEAVNPLKDKIKVLEEKEENLSAENIALRGEATRWRQRATQLIEKSNKVNPEELKKLQSENTGLKKQLTQTQTQVRQNVTQVNNLTAKLKMAEEKLANDVKTKQAEMQKMLLEKNNALLRCNNLNKKVNELDAALRASKSELEKVKAEGKASAESAMTARNLETAVNTHKEEIEKLQADFSKREKELKDQIVAKNSAISKLKTIGRQFKEKMELAEKEVEKQKADMLTIEQELKAVKETLANRSESATTSKAGEVPDTATATIASNDEEGNSIEDLKERLKQADELVQESAVKIAELEEQVEDLKKGNPSLKRIDELEKEIENIRQASHQKGERARGVLKSAKQKMERLTQENAAMTKEIEELKSVNPSDIKTIKSTYENQLNSLKREKEKMEESITKERETLTKRIEELETREAASVAAATTSSAAVAATTGTPPTTTSSTAVSSSSTATTSSSAPSSSSSSDVQTLSVKPMTANSRKQTTAVHPQATIQPTRQKVSVRPMGIAQQRAIRATAASSSTSTTTACTVSVQPTILSVSSISDFGRLADESTTPTAMVTPRGHSAQQDELPPPPLPPPPSIPIQTTSTPVQSSAVPSTSSHLQPGPSTASIAPTPKRPREGGEALEAKKVRVNPIAESVVEPVVVTPVVASTVTTSMTSSITTSTTTTAAATATSSTTNNDMEEDDDEVVVLDSTSEMDEEEEDEEEEEEDDEEDDEDAEAEEVEDEEDEIMEDYEDEDEDREEAIEDNEDEDEAEEEEEDEDEGGPINEQNNLEDEENTAQSYDEEPQNFGGDDVVVGGSDDEDEEEDVEEDVVVVSASSTSTTASTTATTTSGTIDGTADIVPSSSTVTSAVTSSSSSSSAAAAAAVRFDLDDSVVPSTPRLLVSRGRNEGFAEAVSSPSGIPGTSDSTRFVFSQPSTETTGTLSSEGLDRTAMDINQFATDQGLLSSNKSPNRQRGELTSTHLTDTLAVPLVVEGSELTEATVEDEQEDPAVEEELVEEAENTESVAVTSIMGGPQTTSSNVVVASSSNANNSSGNSSSGSNTDRPRITRTPIVWNSPMTPATDSAVIRGARARRSRPGRGRGYSRGSSGGNQGI